MRPFCMKRSIAALCCSNSSIISESSCCVATWRAVRPSCMQRVVTGQQGGRYVRHVCCDRFGYRITLARPGIARIGHNPIPNPNDQHTSHHASSSPPAQAQVHITLVGVSIEALCLSNSSNFSERSLSTASWRAVQPSWLSPRSNDALCSSNSCTFAERSFSAAT